MVVIYAANCRVFLPLGLTAGYSSVQFNAPTQQFFSRNSLTGVTDDMLFDLGATERSAGTANHGDIVHRTNSYSTAVRLLYTAIKHESLPTTLEC